MNKTAGCAKFIRLRCLLIALLLMSQCSFAQLSGSLNGLLHNEIYHITDTVYVEDNRTLTLLGGTVFIFDGPFPFYIRGTLLTEASSADSVVFTTDTLINPDRWRGLRFVGTGSSQSVLNYCLIEHAGISEGLEGGGGVACEGAATPAFFNCTIRSNVVSTGGGGIYCTDSSPAFQSCVIRNNRAQSAGGGIYCFYSNPVFDQCIIEQNFVTDQLATGAGMHLVGSAPEFNDCIFRNNDATSFGSGGAMYCESGCEPIFERCEFVNNHSNNCGVAFFYEGDPLFSHCLIYNNRSEFAGGFYIFYSNARFVKCTLSSNIGSFSGGIFVYRSEVHLNSTILSFSTGNGINFWYDTTSVVQNCCLYGNSGGDFGFLNGDSTNGPDHIGRLSEFNNNNTPCDLYGNILLNPAFVNRANFDFHLLENSPCIDAGDSDLPRDADSSITEIGRFFYGETNTVEPSFEPLAQIFYLHQNYPNPFNNQTQIAFDLAKSAKVELALFDIAGRLVQTLVSDVLAAGTHEINLNSGHLSSGVYLYRLTSGNLSLTRKMILLK